MPSQRSTLKREVVALKRKRIVEAARRLFYEKGYEPTKLDDIAERLGVTKQFIYSYYKTKNELLSEIAEQCICDCLDAQARVLSGKLPIIEKLAKIVEDVTQVIIANQANTIIYLREEMNLEWQIAQKIREQRNEFDHRMMKLLRDGVTHVGALTRLAGAFQGTNYDMKALFRAVLNSETYQRQTRLGDSADEHLQFAAAIGLSAAAGAAAAAGEIGHDADGLPALERALRVRFRDLAGKLVTDDSRVGEIRLGASENVIAMIARC